MAPGNLIWKGLGRGQDESVLPEELRNRWRCSTRSRRGSSLPPQAPDSEGVPPRSARRRYAELLARRVHEGG